jgi:hypothetical protein
MSQISFEIDLSSNPDKAILQKVEFGCELLQRVFNESEFQRWVSKFQWQTNDGQTFRRFYHSCGRNNDQIYHSLVNGAPWDKRDESYQSEDEIFRVVLCNSVEEYNNNCKQPHTICLDQRYLDKSSYTPIHLAAALCQEYCIHLGYPPRGNDLNECWSKFTVPVAIARIVRDVAVIMARDDYQILQWCMLNDTFQFDYQPCSFTFGLQQIGKDLYDTKKTHHPLTEDESTSQESHNGDFRILTSLPN